MCRCQWRNCPRISRIRVNSQPCGASVSISSVSSARYPRIFSRIAAKYPSICTRVSPSPSAASFRLASVVGVVHIRKFFKGFHRMSECGGVNRHESSVDPLRPVSLLLADVAALTSGHLVFLYPLLSYNSHFPVIISALQDPDGPEISSMPSLLFPYLLLLRVSQYDHVHASLQPLLD